MGIVFVFRPAAAPCGIVLVFIEIHSCLPHGIECDRIIPSGVNIQVTARFIACSAAVWLGIPTVKIKCNAIVGVAEACTVTERYDGIVFQIPYSKSACVNVVLILFSVSKRRFRVLTCIFIIADVFQESTAAVVGI